MSETRNVMIQPILVQRIVVMHAQSRQPFLTPPLISSSPLLHSHCSDQKRIAISIKTYMGRVSNRPSSSLLRMGDELGMERGGRGFLVESRQGAVPD